MRRTGPSDTSPEAERVLAEAYRKMSPGRKWALLADLYRLGRRLHASGVRSRKPAATAAEIRADWATMHLSGPGSSGRAEGARDVEQPIENQAVIREVIAALDALEIDYALGGSLASSIHGVTRMTTDADLTVEPFAGKEADFVGRFGPDYYASPDAIRQAIRSRSTFNVINTAVGFKVDVFVRKDQPFDRSVMSRRVAIDADDSGAPIWVVSPEDIILHKLQWYRLGGEISERQWSDVLGVLRVQGDRLDAAYLDRWAGTLGVADLLAEARQAAGGDGAERGRSA